MTSRWETVLVLVAIAAVLARIAWRDGTRFEVAWGDVLALAALGVWWQGTAAWEAVLGGVGLGVGGIASVMALSRWRGARVPACAGDLMLMGAAGAVLGPVGLAVSWVVNVPAHLAYRWWLGRRRGRAWLRGYVPMGPSYCVSAEAVLVWQAVMGRNGWV